MLIRNFFLLNKIVKIDMTMSPDLKSFLDKKFEKCERMQDEFKFYKSLTYKNHNNMILDVLRAVALHPYINEFIMWNTEL